MLTVHAKVWLKTHISRQEATAQRNFAVESSVPDIPLSNKHPQHPPPAVVQGDHGFNGANLVSFSMKTFKFC